jgi:hypothetical protein
VISGEPDTATTPDPAPKIVHHIKETWRKHEDGLVGFLGRVPAAASSYEVVVADDRPVPCPRGDDLDVFDEFFAGYFDAGGTSTLRHITCLIWCESRWQLETSGIFLGLGQFHKSTWATVSAWTGFNDWRNPYHQGFNVATWAAAIESPGGTGGWPHCWWT